jgi:nucleoside-diphosphate-sugar epimerase
MVHISSIAAIGRSGDNNKEMTEEEEWGESRYNSAYGISKYLAETEVWRGIGEGLTAVIVNPGIILGVCEKRDPPARLLKLADNGFPFYTNGVTSWVDVSDVVNAIVHLMQSEIEAERFILSSGNYSFREIIASMASALDKRPPHLFAGKILSGLAWRWSVLKSNFSGKPAFLTRETALNANLLSLYSNKKLYDFLPAFTYTPLNTSIEQMAMHFRNSDKN